MKIIFDYVWDYQEPVRIKRTTMYLPIGQGGIGLLYSKFQQQALRIKMLFEIVNAASNKTWVYYARYWVSSQLSKYNDDWNFLQNNDSPRYNGTDPPVHYKEVVNFIRDFGGALSRLKGITTKEIYNLFFQKEYTSYKIKVERYWNVDVSKNLPWQQLWQNNYKSYAHGKQQDILFKIMHNCLPTRHQLQKGIQLSKRRLEINCKRYHTLETTQHIFAPGSYGQRINQYMTNFKQLSLFRRKLLLSL